MIPKNESSPPPSGENFLFNILTIQISTFSPNSMNQTGSKWTLNGGSIKLKMAPPKFSTFLLLTSRLTITCWRSAKNKSPPVPTSGDKIIFSQRENDSFDYTFDLRYEAGNELKRLRSKNKKFSPKVKSIKTEISLDELECSICLETWRPCLHRFCSGCLSESLQFSTKCPNCCEELIPSRKDPFLLFLIPKATEQFPERQRSEEECKKSDEKDVISRG